MFDQEDLRNDEINYKLGEQGKSETPLDLPVSPRVFFDEMEMKGWIPEEKYEILTPSQAGELGFLVDKSISVRKLGSVVATEDVEYDVARAIAYAAETVPKRAAQLLNLPIPDGHVPIIVSGGALRLKTGQRVPAVNDLVGDQVKFIRISQENVRLAFNLPHDQKNELDPIVSFAVAAHELTDWVQSRAGIHDGIFHDESETDTKARAVKHMESKSEQASNRLATDLTEEYFGVTITWGDGNENNENIYTPEPSSS